MPLLYYLPDERCVEIEETDTILASSLYAGIPHIHVCGGSARCSTCRVWVLEGLEYCSPRNDAEDGLAKRLCFDPKMRLACQTQVLGESKVTVRRLVVDAEDMSLVEQQLSGQRSAIGEEQMLAVLFADLRGFTSFAEVLPAYDVIYVLNRYFSRMGQIIERYGGIINNYMGDGFMALFGWNCPDRPVERAVRAALDMQTAMDAFNAYLETLYQRQLKIGIGIHYGSVVVGAVGASPKSQQMTAIGDTVNLASRIEAANKAVGTSLLVSEAVYQQVQPLVSLGRQCDMSLPGKSGEYRLYEVIDIVPDATGAIALLAQSCKPQKPSRFRRVWAWLCQLGRRMIGVGE
ncbi:adenylate/guanylate cyclase domain-containing protein [Thermoleptolyngbya sp. C42_A2020_037]|uniref:adenylate/guanylate cyclase domain-containing protein n=1 Tax=Thermoleptolyngbya sp. C42_A2020_037 TaxID=2747799 RepID=UPI0019E695EB|nr:adenylate/guanylate cyclase domain-containing protein [Thermoleptolyngbya sp. C42_A2020_037]MBF2086213.1 adenylate/guanylate cyclase domain-containing protein [Thermoleptolyngbya sp. C42_A2020_037]